MILTLATYHSKKIAFFIGYLFFLSGLCSFVYGRNYITVQKNMAPVFNDTYYAGNGPVKQMANVNIINDSPSDEINDKGKGKQKKYAQKERKAADIGGPSQPEMSAFKAVGADNMVDPFSGDFSYNIPLLDVGGYPVNIFYNSGITMDQEASWVGLGWNINPGTITRNMRGLPDDFNGSEIIKKTQYTKPEKIWGVNVGAGAEIFGFPLKIDVEGGIFFNNKRGVGLHAGIKPSLAIGGHAGDQKTAPLSLGWKLSGNSQSGGSSTFSIDFQNRNKESLLGSFSASIGTHSRQGLQDLHLSASLRTGEMQRVNVLTGESSSSPGVSFNTSISFAYPAFMPAMRSRINTRNYDIDINAGFSFQGGFAHANLGGYYTEKSILPENIEIKQPGYGMLYLKKGQDDKNALMDFNRLNDGMYTPNAPAISIPVYTYDVFAISGEGTGGAFRAYRGDLGYMQDAFIENNGESDHLGIDLGAGSYGHIGVNANIVKTPASSGGWDKGNLAKNQLKFTESKSDTQAVYFKNPGEKAIPDINWQNGIGGEDLVRLKLTNTGFGSPTITPSFVRYDDMLQPKADLPFTTASSIKKRDKRSQVITFLRADEADRAGLNKKINYIPLSDDSSTVVFGCQSSAFKTLDRNGDLRKANHISEIDVLMPDGRKYVYDVPVYNKSQKDVTFNITGSGSGTTANNPIANYTDGEHNVPKENNVGKDGFVEAQETPPYAHSYLLSALLSPNYVDVKGDGITEDDMGDAIKFNYSKYQGYLKWRTPHGSTTVNLSEGLKTDRDDDKGHYVFGERELWYLYSIESKNMVARFYVKKDRKDSRAVTGETGGLDADIGAYRLSKISLFTKGELLKNPSNPRPVKTVHFVYDYSLCPDVPDNSGVAEVYNGVNINEAKGKLTLKAIYFTYNGNNRTKKNYYKFSYPSGTGNPTYSFTENDRWGNYKSDNELVNGNPGTLKNADFPYSPSDATKANDYAKAWTLNKVTLPSGAEISVDYESDDYAFVQDRRASRMTTISGFGTSTTTAGTSNMLYDGSGTNYDVLYITVPRAITATTTTAIRSQIKEWYLGNSDKTSQVLMKLAVQMPADARGSGYELLPVYADVLEYGLVTGSNSIIYLKVKKLASNYTPMVHYSLQFLKSNLPSKAYPGYDVSESGGLKGVVKALDGLFHSFKEIFKGGMKLLIAENRCKYVDLGKSFIRLSDPWLSKKGGGLRVKKVTITDKWNKMTNTAPGGTSNGMPDATYGQEYFYTKKEMVNGVSETISSGVANWEPSIGAEENPHRQAKEYYNKNPRADYDYSVMELPLAEMLFPSASVGYSRVETRSIHRDTVKNAPGITVQEFYTSREFPAVSGYTLLTEHNATDRYESNALDKLLKVNVWTNVALSQGFKVDLNDMHGKLKKQSTYSPNNLNDPISYTENFYSMVKTGQNNFKLNHSFPVIAGADGKVQSSVIGREIELMTDFREHHQQTITTNINPNIDIIQVFGVPIPVPTVWKPVTKEHNIYRSVSTLKVVNHFAILDSVVAVDKGSMVSTKNLVYDAETGDPLLTRTNNEQNKPIYNFSYPAHWAYSGMGMAYKNIDVLFKELTFRNGKMDPSPNANLSLLESGDELLVEPAGGWSFVLGNSPCEPIFMPATRAVKIWAVHTGKAGSATPQWIFIDANGVPFTAGNVNVRIIRSGKRNIGSAGLGSIVSLNNPVNPSNGQLEFTDATNILQVSAATYKDHWRVDNSLYVKDSLVSVAVQARIKRNNYPAVQSYTLTANYKNGWPYEFFGHTSNPTPLLNRSKGFKNHTLKTDDWLLFNLQQTPIPAAATIIKGYLSFNAHVSYATSPPVTITGHENDGRTLHPSNWSHQNNPTAINDQNYLGLIRLKSNWPTNLQGWNSLMADRDRNLHDWSALSVINPTEVRSAKSYVLSTGSDSRIDFTAATKSMVTDFQNTGNIYSTGIRVLGMRNTIKKDVDVFQCFWAKDPREGYNKFTPTMNVYYYVCGDISFQSSSEYALPGDPVDPLVNSLVNCNNTISNYQFCRSKFTQRKSINPYVEGIWGNWRVDTSFVYYGDRKENTVVENSPVDLRTGGTIINFKKFWTFSTTPAQYLQRNYAATDVWVWNSTITQYNRKGYEIENKDPLGRFNAGLYGYNQQLPIAVVNNSRYMESMYDGFEDYDYQSNSCTETCKPRRHVDMGAILPYLDASQKHTGKKSLKLNTGQTFTFYAPVTGTSNLDKPYSVRVKVDSTTITDTIVGPNGNGLLGKYKKFSKNGHTWLYAANTAISVIDNNYNTSRTDIQVNLGTGAGQLPPPASIGWGSFVTRWDGYLLPKSSGVHHFRIAFNDGMRLSINGQSVADWWDRGNSGTKDGSILLTKGQPVSIRVDYWDGTPTGQANLLWKDPQMSGFDLVPQSALYTPDKLAVAQSSVTITTGWCTKTDSINVRGNALTDTFTLVQNKKMLISAWVKVGGNDCKCSTYLNNKIKISYTGSSLETELTPAGSIIEGWQRYEAAFTIPATASKLKVELMNTGSTATAWFDDLRIHPFNANMKSFVYHPQNLRLMSELDENNYASFYEYDDDGTLTRVKKETIRGIKTITETRSHLQKMAD